MTIPSNCVNTI